MPLTFLSRFFKRTFILAHARTLHPLPWATRMRISGQKFWFHKSEKHCLREPALLLVLQAGWVTGRAFSRISDVLAFL